jgi:Carboxypeptidase regulatory-like domain/TonB dependent receptor
MKISGSLVVAVIAILLVVPALQGQTSQGRILGAVTDQSGALVAHARVTITNTATNATRAVDTTSSGDFSAPNLDPGTYTVAAEAKGFKKIISTPILLEVSREVRVDLKLQPGLVTETMVVTAEGALVDTTDTTLNGVLSNKAINELPVQGRDFQNLLELHPGVQRTPGGGFHSVTSNGNRPDDNNFFIDGADDNDAYYGETVVNDAGIQGTPASILPLDAIQEFNTQEGPAADYGVKPGVVMNIGIKSGTNTVHGTAYYFHRNAAFDARNYYDPAPAPMSALLMHEFGASVGGPIKKDKWFYFVNYEGIRDKVGNPGLTDSPVTTSIANQLGGIADPDTGEPISALYSAPDAIAYFNNPTNVGYCQQNYDSNPTCAVNPLSVQLSQLFLPNSGFTLTQSDPAGINFDFKNRNRGDNLIAKSDYTLSPHHVLSVRFIYSNTDQTEQDTSPLRPEWLSTTSPVTQVFGVSLASSLGSSWTNEVRFSYNRFNEIIFPGDHNVNPLKYGLNTGVTDPRLFGFPRINPGTGEFNYMGGNSSWPLATAPSKTDSFSDTATYTHGKHSLRFGGSFRYGDVNYFRAGYGRGRVDFRHLPNFIAGDVRRWRFLYGDPQRDVSMKSFGLFAQDDFRLRPNLTLNLGVRYDVTCPIKDAHNQLANYIPVRNGQPGGLVQVGQGIDSPYPTNHNNLSPRIGVAWDVFGNGKTVFRSGFGLIFEQPSIRTFMFNGGGLNLNPSGVPYMDGSGNIIQPKGTINSFLRISSDGSLINWSPEGPIFPTASGNLCSLFDDGGNVNQCDVFAVDPHLRTPYVMNWNLNLQQQLGKDAVLQIGYVANHGVKLYSITDINQVDPNSPLEVDATGNGNSPCEQIAGFANCEGPGRPLNENCPVAQGGLGLGGPCFPYLGFFNYLSNHSDSTYHSLQVTLTKRYSHGLYLLAGYTWSHAIDTATSNLAGVPPNSLNYNAQRGNGDEDIRNRFTLSVTYDLPSRKAPLQMLEGWEATSIVNLQTGAPYTPSDSSNDISGTGELNDRWNFWGNPADIHWSATTPVPFFSDGTTNPACVAHADPNADLADFGCFQQGNAVLTPPAALTFGNMRRNIFRGPGFANWDFSVSKLWKLNERVKLQFRGEVFNILNHTNFDGQFLNTDLSSPDILGLTTFTPDVAASNPVIGSGGSRHIQLGAKIIW